MFFLLSIHEGPLRLHTLGRYVQLPGELTNPRLAIYYYLRTISTIDRAAVSLKR